MAHDKSSSIISLFLQGGKVRKNLVNSKDAEALSVMFKSKKNLKWALSDSLSLANCLLSHAWVEKYIRHSLVDFMAKLYCIAVVK